jgi:hypothetical protein
MPHYNVSVANEGYSRSPASPLDALRSLSKQLQRECRIGTTLSSYFA